MPKKQSNETTYDPQNSAKAAGLHYVSDVKPGITRSGKPTRFRYTYAAGKPVRDAETLARIKSLVIPPAWTDVWICAESNGHLQVTGRDARGRKQSRYHTRWREVRDGNKYAHMLHFGAALPAIRRQVEQDLATKGLSQQKVLATVLKLMELTHIRVGNEEYARENHSYGLTTLRNQHVQVTGSSLKFKFKGKSGVEHEVDVVDKRLSKIVKMCHDLPGHELFEYENADGSLHCVDSASVNSYLKEITGQHFTAKDFRTWAGTVLAYTLLLRDCSECSSASQAKKNVVQAIKEVAARLGNTPSVCRKCYVHPSVIKHYLSRAVEELPNSWITVRGRGKTRGLHQEEREMLAFLKANT